jgi:photosystem II stability/assembly factor-like uncharacterized protein
MNMKNLRIFCLILTLLSIGFAHSTEMAEVMPKFKESMYLDVETNHTSIVAVGERGQVAISTDYGETWHQSKNVPTKATLTSLSMIGQNVWAVGHDTTILYSDDAGENWIIQFEDKLRQMPLLDVLFIDESTGFAIGAYGTYLTTYDGGKTWKDSLIIEDQDFHLNKIIKVDEFKLFVVAEAGHAYRSFDLGKTWESLVLPYSGSMFGANVFRGKIVTYGLRGHVLVTEDFGDSFIEIDSPVEDSLFGSEHTINDKLLIVGANGAVLQFKNMSLSKIDIPNSDGDYTDLVSIKDNKLIFVGESGISTKQIR